jgi:hypothetical protein
MADTSTQTDFEAAQSTQTQIENPAEFLAREFDRCQSLFAMQPTLTQRFLEAEGRKIAEAIIQQVPQVRFSLPNRILIKAHPDGREHERSITAAAREQLAGGLMDRLTRTGIQAAVRQRLEELEASPNEAVSLAAVLTRHAAAQLMVHQMLPDGRSVQYVPVEGEEIPTLPVEDETSRASAITAQNDAIVEATHEAAEEERGELIVPFMPYARRFFLPQWVALDADDGLLVHSVNQAEADLASMQQYLKVLHAAISLAAYMVADPEYQRKRHGMLGQLINQGRALARFQTREIIETIQRRAAAHDLNRGLSLSLPYFDDQSLAMKSHDFDIIPAGRIMFVPAFVVVASRKEQVKVDQDTRLSRATRRHLLTELQMLEFAFSDTSH